MAEHTAVRGELEQTKSDHEEIHASHRSLEQTVQEKAAELESMREELSRALAEQAARDVLITTHDQLRVSHDSLLAECDSLAERYRAKHDAHILSQKNALALLTSHEDDKEELESCIEHLSEVVACKSREVVYLKREFLHVQLDYEDTLEALSALNDDVADSISYYHSLSLSNMELKSTLGNQY